MAFQQTSRGCALCFKALYFSAILQFAEAVCSRVGSYVAIRSHCQIRDSVIVTFALIVKHVEIRSPVRGAGVACQESQRIYWTVIK